MIHLFAWLISGHERFLSDLVLTAIEWGLDAFVTVYIGGLIVGALIDLTRWLIKIFKKLEHSNTVT